MFQVKMKMSWAFRSLLALTILVSWVSGVGFYIFNNYIQIEGEFGPQKHPLQNTFLKVHGAAAFAMILGYGYLLATHIPIGFKAKRERILGMLLTLTQLLQIFTAYYLYYGSDIERRELVAWTHFSVGFFFPGLVLLHIFVGRHNTKKRKIRRSKNAKLGAIG